MNKTKVIYGTTWDPTLDHVQYVAIQTESTPPYVFCTYGNSEKTVKSGSGFAVLPIAEARNLFDFEKGSIADVVMKE